MQLAFYFDVSRCSGCMACVVACLDENDLPGGELTFRRVGRLEEGVYPSVKISFLTVSCLHCSDAPCVTACPAGALQKRMGDGIVQADQDRCVGCRSCSLACPFGAPQFPDGEKMRKCDLCLHRITKGLEPACVRVCPTKALGFGPMEKSAAQRVERASRAILSSVWFPTR